MVDTVLDMILADVDQACRLFGTYTFQDKGAQEVMDLDRITEVLRALHPDECADVLCELVALSESKTYQNSPVMECLVSDLLVALQDVDDAFFDVLMSRPELQELF